jgi:hypothetical protein
MLSFMAGLPMASSANHPEMKLLIDYGFFDSVQQYVIQPAIQLFLIGETINQTINFNGKSLVYSYDVNFTNLTITQFDLDWEKSHFLSPGPNNGSIIQIRGLNLTLAMDLSITVNSIFHTESACNCSIFDLNADIGLAFSPNPAGTSFYVSIPSATVDFDSMKLSFDSTLGSVFASILNFIVANLAKSLVKSTISSFLTGEVSNQIQNLTMNGIGIPYSILNITLTIPEQPIVHISPNQNYITIGFQLNLVNNQTGEQAPAFFEERIVDQYGVQAQQLKLMIASNLLNQVGWAVKQLNIINVTISSKDLPADVPLSLNTTALKILIPELAMKFGPGKGVYIAIKQATAAPRFSARHGRFAGTLSTIIEFWVDTDGKNYPEEGLANCTTCLSALVLNNTLLFDVNLFKIDSSHVGVTILNLDIVDLSIVSGEEFDAYDLKVSINQLLSGFIPTINAGLASGIEIPLIEYLGINDITVGVHKNYLGLKIAMNEPSK